MKIKNKGKVYPSPSSSSSSSDGNYLSVLKILPAAILAIVSVLSLEDREVLAYLITRSIKTTTTSTANLSSSIVPKKSSKKTANGINNVRNMTHKPPVFDCHCFDCYTIYWFRWDSSPNRELIHHAIEAFEDHLTNGESEKSKKNAKGKRRDKTTRRSADNKHVVVPSQPDASSHGKQVGEVTLESSSSTNVVVPEAPPENDLSLMPVSSSEKNASLLEENEVVKVSGESSAAVVEEDTSAIVRSPMAASSCTHKGLARKVLPDVLGLFHSRLWSLWSPNVSCQGEN